MAQTVGTLVGIALAALLFSVLARLAWKLGGCVGVPLSLLLWVLWALTVWRLLVTAGGSLLRAGR